MFEKVEYCISLEKLMTEKKFHIQSLLKKQTQSTSLHNLMELQKFRIHEVLHLPVFGPHNNCPRGLTKSRPLFGKSLSNSEKALARFVHTFAIFTSHMIILSNESREIADRVSIRLFRKRNQLDSALRGPNHIIR
jgi:hypothetical protein